MPDTELSSGPQLPSPFRRYPALGSICEGVTPQVGFALDFPLPEGVIGFGYRLEPRLRNFRSQVLL